MLYRTHFVELRTNCILQKKKKQFIIFKQTRGKEIKATAKKAPCIDCTIIIFINVLF